MVLFHQIIEILHLADDDRGPMLGIVAPNGRRTGLTAIDGDLVGNPVAADRFLEKVQGGLLIPLLRQQKVNGLAVSIYGAIEVAPLALCAGNQGHIDAEVRAFAVGE
jgi:hypothetical protein